MIDYIKGETDGCFRHRSGCEMAGLVLASASPRRVELLGSLGLDFDVVASMADEDADPLMDPRRMVEELARRKASAVAVKHRCSVVLGADTVVCIDGRVLGKPADAEDAARMLQSLQGREHVVYTGVCVIKLDEGIEEAASEATYVRFAPMSGRDIEKYVESKEPMDKAGAYAIQGLGSQFITGITGDYSNVVGLPLRLTGILLGKAGISVL